LLGDWKFLGPTPGWIADEGILPNPVAIWDLYWSDEVLSKIIKETNAYARQPRVLNQGLGKTNRGPTWYDVDIPESKLGWAFSYSWGWSGFLVGETIGSFQKRCLETNTSMPLCH
jgi:hypothetical protein